MTHTATPTHPTHVPPWRRRLLATALIVGAGTAVGASQTGLTSDGGRGGDPLAIDAIDHPNHGPDGDTTTTTTSWTGDAKDHPNYGPVDTATSDPGDHHLDRRRQRPPQLRTRRHRDQRPRRPPPGLATPKTTPTTDPSTRASPYHKPFGLWPTTRPGRRRGSRRCRLVDFRSPCGRGTYLVRNVGGLPRAEHRPHRPWGQRR